MLVCQCNGVSDRSIRKAVRGGAVTLDEVGQACSAGTCCGGCADSIVEVIHSESSSRDIALPLATAPQPS